MRVRLARNFEDKTKEKSNYETLLGIERKRERRERWDYKKEGRERGKNGSDLFENGVETGEEDNGSDTI